ncbi:hypothetical protein PVL29_009522 [Vitis rotundifolia]|uniref:Uncharacterized protein n=1 Tax=Vitis rotundifolia TaxID=103349 RepID=A0AA38ZQX6_VITRO|nr:hypothetical protein PVL29_009522 [Vitis rotundifolia]
MSLPFRQQGAILLIPLVILMTIWVYHPFLDLLLPFWYRDEILLIFLMTRVKRNLILKETVLNKSSWHFTRRTYSSEDMKVSAWELHLLGVLGTRGNTSNGDRILYQNGWLGKGQAIPCLKDNQVDLVIRRQALSLKLSQ